MRAIKVKLDENLGKTHAEFLRQAGYHAERIHDQGLSGWSDEEVWKKVCKEQRLFITLDKDFANLRKYPLGSHAGIVLLRPYSHSRTAVLRILEKLLSQYVLEDLYGCLVVADEYRVRIRRPSEAKR
ncbi:MAG: hypothetical protein DFNUSKGM_001836 [Candidatus Fervidibacter sacchari]